MSFQTFFDAYLECALRSSTDESDESGGNPMDQNYDVDAFNKSCLAGLRAEAKDFYKLNEPKWCDALSDEQAGHDFWLTRNGHGAGFWDRGLLLLGYVLTQASKEFGVVDLYIYRRRVYASGYEKRRNRT